ncbi:serine-rich protein-related [Striga asiatica]|uniref:Serine-rich protein-related n=1 Tax=Striga asiatica TaxID=4170 RepID=A0A5A7PRS6_STRAF|nr:serine-rich protein-related [Striga asiatica]
MAASSRKSKGGVIPVSLGFRRSGPFCTSVTSDPSPFTSASSSSFASSSTYYSSSPSGGFFTHRRSVSPKKVEVHTLSPPPPTPSVRFPIDRSISPRRSIAASPPPRNQVVQRSGGVQRRTCLCSPTTHPGSFRCALHKNSFGGVGGGRNGSAPYSPHRLNMRRSAMTNSLVRIGTVEGDLVKRALAALIRPSSHQQRRRADFRPRQSRLSMNYPSIACWHFPFAVAIFTFGIIVRHLRPLLFKTCKLQVTIAQLKLESGLWT